MKLSQSGLQASEAAHVQQLSTWWGSLDDYAQAHGAFGTEISEFGPRSLISFSLDRGVAQNFGDYIFEFKVPRSNIIPQTLPGANEAEVLIINGISK
jgi:hypothetical protein